MGGGGWKGDPYSKGQGRRMPFVLFCFSLGGPQLDGSLDKHVLGNLLGVLSFLIGSCKAVEKKVFQ